MPRVSKKSGAYHHGDLRRALIDAAIGVMVQEGVGALSLHAIARKAGVSSGAPYHHFESREQLLAAIAVEGFERLATEMKRAAEEAEAGAAGGPETASAAYLRGLGLGYVRFALANRGHFRVMFRPELKAHLSPEQHTLVEQAFSMLNQAIARCQMDGSIAAGDTRPLVLLAWSTVHGASSLWIDGPLSTEALVEGEDRLGPAIAGALVNLVLRQPGDTLAH